MRTELSPVAPTAGRVLPPGLLAAFVVAGLVLILTFVVGVTSLRKVYETSDAVAHTYEVKADLEALLSTLTDAETGGRGYVITGDEEFLESYNRARQEITGRVNHAASLLQHSAEQEADLGLIAAAADLKMRNVAEGIRLRRVEGFEAARTKVSDKAGKHAMDQLRSIIDRMEAREDTLLAARVPEADRSFRLASVARGVSLGVGLLALAAVYVITVRYGKDRMRTTQVLQEQQVQLRETLRLKDEFVSVVSHELRTPTNTIAGWARMLADHGMSPERSGQAIATISRNAESLRQLIDDLMDTSLLVSGRMRLSTDPVDLVTVVRDAVETVRLSADNKGVVLLAETPAGVPLTVIGDSGRLTQVVCNLLANAIKFTPPGGQVAVALVSIATGAKLTVADTGAGIDPVFLPHVFERFRQGTSGTGAKKGVGLGLAIVQHLVELHGGTITADSAGPGKGARFTVEFPFVAVAHRAATATWSGVGSGKQAHL